MKIKDLLLSLLIFGICTFTAADTMAQSRTAKELKPVCDSLAVLLKERTGVDNKLTLKNVTRRGSALDFYFDISLSDYPWRSEDIAWFRKTLRKMLPQKYCKYSIDRIYTNLLPYDVLDCPPLKNSGSPSKSKQRVKDPSREKPLVRSLDGQNFSKGLSGRHIAVWHSHGRYYNLCEERWKWQRPFLFQTCEDLFTQSFVLPFLIPMLENAGAVVLTPRERDIQTNEVIVDNDAQLTSRTKGSFKTTGKWENIPGGFADTSEVYFDRQNPFAAGSFLKATTVGKKQNAGVIWRPEIPERGSYAVYVSYKSLSNSTEAARYTVHHAGGSSAFSVNQKMGGGMWVYLGTFVFDKGADSYVELSNATDTGEHGTVVTADAVRFGGGMGNIARGVADSTATISGLPRYCEGARYNLQWSGFDDRLYSPFECGNDYKDDYSCRGDWVTHLAGDSRIDPKHPGRGIPFDLALGLHSDAGVTPNDSIIGTLAIYTYKSEGRSELPSKESRLTNREFADMVQSQVVHDIREDYDTLWARRQIWNRSYRASRTPSCPSMLLEMLSHQNFADMRHGLNPEFRFSVSRAVYKGMLKYLSNRYGCNYAVQPLPVDNLGVSFGPESTAVLQWKPVEDRLEPTASPKGYIVYTRIDDGAFDTGRILAPEDIRKLDGGILSCSLPLEEGHICSFRVVAFNDGGRSFPSETVCIALPKGCNGRKVLTVNNFDRVSAPADFDTPLYSGFDNYTDSGVPYIQDIAFTGVMHQFHRESQYCDDDNAGFGSSFRDYACTKVAGNSFDNIFTHGRALLDAGYAFYSCSNETFITDSLFSAPAWTVDLICGKQLTTAIGECSRYSVFPAELQKRLTDYALEGGNIIISGSYIATDIYEPIFATAVSSEARQASIDFAANILGYKHCGTHASRSGRLMSVRNRPLFKSGINVRLSSDAGFPTKPNPDIYCVENPNGLIPASASARTFLRYADTEISAAVHYSAKTHKAVSFGFPLETLASPSDLSALLSASLDYISGK
ncbi:MAG: xanthan lyase [Candidatus Cryptobacteroides sp.]